MLTYGLAKKSISSYNGAINNSLSELAKENNIISSPLNTIHDAEYFKQVSYKIQSLPVFKSKNNSGNKMYSNALNRYADYLLETSVTHIEQGIRNDPSIKSTQKIALIQARVGQGKFRESQINLWKGSCSVSGYKGTSLLIASHIKPWSKASNTERLDRYNGLLLAPNLDKAFDKGFITFSSEGNVIVSKELQDPKSLGISTSLQIKDLPKEVEKYMAFHRKNVFNDA